MNLNQYSVAAAQPGLSADAIGRLMVPIPPVAEQKSIATTVEAESAATDLLITEAEAAITLLQERRSALISAAVTGKIDVRNLTSNQAEAA